MRRFLVRFSESEASNHTPSLADFTTTTPELKFSVHTGRDSRPMLKMLIISGPLLLFLRYYGPSQVDGQKTRVIRW